MQRLMTLKAARERLSISRSFLYELIQAGLLDRVFLQAPPSDTGRPRRSPVRLTVSSVEKYERGGATPNSPPQRSPRDAPARARRSRSADRGVAHFR